MKIKDPKELIKLLPRQPSSSPARLAAQRNLSSKRLKNLKKHAVPPNGVLNPYGSNGTRSTGKDDLSLRPEAIKRNRLKLEQKRAKALEAHELQQIAREAATKAMKTLIKICVNERAPEATRIAASTAILDRGYGKASQTSITANVTNGKASDITSDELDKRVKAALRRVNDITNRTGETGAGKKRPANLRLLN